jgi:hypothetical protein
VGLVKADNTDLNSPATWFVSTPELENGFERFQKVPWASRPWLFFRLRKTTGQTRETRVIQVFQSDLSHVTVRMKLQMSDL